MDQFEHPTHRRFPYFIASWARHERASECLDVTDLQFKKDRHTIAFDFTFRIHDSGIKPGRVRPYTT